MFRGGDFWGKWVGKNRAFRSVGSRETQWGDRFYIFSPRLLGSISTNRSAGLNLSPDRLMALLRLYLCLFLLRTADNKILPLTPSLSWHSSHIHNFSPRYKQAHSFVCECNIFYREKKIHSSIGTGILNTLQKLPSFYLHVNICFSYLHIIHYRCSTASFKEQEFIYRV